MGTTVMSGEERKQEALKRRGEFLKKQENINTEIKSSEFKMMSVKSRQELEEEREAYIKNAVLRIQEEALSMSQRMKMEEQKRLEMLKMEEERIKREETMRQEAIVKAERNVRSSKSRARKENSRKTKKGRRGEKSKGT